MSLAILEGKIVLEELPQLDPLSVRKKLTSIKGIGNWTSDVYLMFCLQDKHIFPSGDIAIINTMKELGLARTKEEIALLTQKWKPLRSLAAYFFCIII